MTQPSPSQLKAVKLALPSGYLRRLPGGFWVGEETPWRGNHGMLHVPTEQYVGTQTVEACRVRGWMEVADHRARLTDDGRALSSTEQRGQHQ